VEAGNRYDRCATAEPVAPKGDRSRLPGPGPPRHRHADVAGGVAGPGANHQVTVRVRTSRNRPPAIIRSGGLKSRPGRPDAWYMRPPQRRPRGAGGRGVPRPGLPPPPVNSPYLSRRRFLAASGLLGGSVALGLGACGRSASSGSGSGTFSGSLGLLLPGEVPIGWETVLAEVNARLGKDLGFTIAPQFIPWADYQEQSLLKFTAGARFDTALQARWLNMTQLAQDGSLADLTGKLAALPNLSRTVAPAAISANTWSGKLWGVPQVNGAGRLAHFGIRQDLAEKYRIGTISDFDTLEKYWYDVKQYESNVTPMPLYGRSAAQTCTYISVPLFNRAFWEDPNRGVPQQFTGDSVSFYFARDAAARNSSDPVPFWELPEVVDAFRRTRRYHFDGIINDDALRLDNSTVTAYFTSGRSATIWAMTDGLSSAVLPALRKSVPTAMMANVIPLRGGTAAKPNQTFQADNFVVLNAHGESNEAALHLEDWLSIKENHDLLEYGIEGTDWRPVGDDQYEALTQYTFPGFALCWRSSLERLANSTTPSERAWFTWAQSYDNFTADTFAGFIPDVTPVTEENTRLAAAMARYGSLLSSGAVDVDTGLSDLKRACESAGLAKVQAELAKQGDAYLAAR
jgi:putative aldouronate transport system substrate-binding protein